MIRMWTEKYLIEYNSPGTKTSISKAFGEQSDFNIFLNVWISGEMLLQKQMLQQGRHTSYVPRGDIV